MADTGTWLASQQVLISPHALGDISTGNESITVNLTKQQIADSPPLRKHEPVSRQFEMAHYKFFGWPLYWGGSGMWGNTACLIPVLVQGEQDNPDATEWDPNLRSTDAVDGYHIHASDGEIGHIVDFIIDDDTWAIRYLVVDTRNLWPGKLILVSPHWIEKVSWSESQVFVNLTRDTIKSCPEFNDEVLLRREYEAELHHHYDVPGYWVDESVGDLQVR